ncbi:MAG TPA: carbohydrate kinase family protein, partial [Verrucomicrobiales bacterium]|nr:carbohydrate kinase family protein [Verrucomicrobiales bacterium]
DFTRTRARLFHLGYLMLLDEMDRLLPGGGTSAARVLAAAQKAGLLTSVDIVSTENPDFRAIAEAALPHTDFLVINEVEAGKVAGVSLKTNPVNVSAVCDAARALLERGVQRQVVIHFEAGAVVADRSGEVSIQASLNLPEGFIAGATGAGDAFAAGYLHGVHEGFSTADSLTLAVCTAAACLTHPAPSMGLRPVAECLRLADEHGFRAL